MKGLAAITNEDVAASLGIAASMKRAEALADALTGSGMNDAQVVLAALLLAYGCLRCGMDHNGHIDRIVDLVEQIHRTADLFKHAIITHERQNSGVKQ